MVDIKYAPAFGLNALLHTVEKALGGYELSVDEDDELLTDPAAIHGLLTERNAAEDNALARARM